MLMVISPAKTLDYQTAPVTARFTLPEHLDEAQELMGQLREIFETLSPMEADILRKRMGLDDNQEMTLKEIGARYSLSRERIRQVQEQALAKLRGEFKRRALM